MADSCVTGLVGLSAAGSDCFPLPTPAPGQGNDYITASATGLYVDQVEGLPLKPAQSHAPGTGLYALLDRCRQQAEQVVENALNVRVQAQLGAQQFGKVGLLGGAGNGRPGTLARLVLPTASRPGKGLQLFGVQLQTTIQVVDAPLLLDGQLVGTITTNAELFAPLAGVVVPLDGLPHTLSAQLGSGPALPLSNALTCNCGGDPWVQAVKGNLAPGANMKADAGGFIVQAREVCLSGSPLCHGISQTLPGTTTLTPQSAEFRRSVGFAIQYKTAEHLLVHFMANQGYNRYTTLEPNSMSALAKRFSNLCEEHLAWLSSSNGLAAVPNDCYACKETAPRMKVVYA